jgi:hypothetical protein
MTKPFVLTALLLTSGAAAFAQAPSETTKAGTMTDPNEVVCIREPVIGSRVNTTRVCRTRSEWAEIRRQYRQNIERAQSNRPSAGQ